MIKDWFLRLKWWSSISMACKDKFSHLVIIIFNSFYMFSIQHSGLVFLYSLLGSWLFLLILTKQFCHTLLRKSVFCIWNFSWTCLSTTSMRISQGSICAFGSSWRNQRGISMCWFVRVYGYCLTLRHCSLFCIFLCLLIRFFL